MTIPRVALPNALPPTHQALEGVAHSAESAHCASKPAEPAEATHHLLHLLHGVWPRKHLARTGGKHRLRARKGSSRVNRRVELLSNNRARRTCIARICDGVSFDRSGMPFGPIGGIPPAGIPGRPPAPPRAAAILPILRGSS